MPRGSADPIRIVVVQTPTGPEVRAIALADPRRHTDGSPCTPCRTCNGKPRTYKPCPTCYGTGCGCPETKP